MEQLVPIAAKLKDVLGALGHDTSLDLPQICVIGSQSSGKSSVLEGIVGRTFLPRGTGVVTRRPLILTLRNTSEAPDDHKEDYYEFGHAPSKRKFDGEEIRKEILRDTERLISSSSKAISPKPILLTIYSPHVLSLTLIDLPGLTKVAVADQPTDIEHQIRSLCLSYAVNPSAILLAVTGANSDLANSDALKLARDVDPAGERTLGVLTKLDLMDKGTDCANVLRNELVPLKMGYVAMVNRGQMDVDNSTPLAQGLRKESEFFALHPSYKNLRNRCGTNQLSKTLNHLLMQHIRDCLPELKQRIIAMTQDLQHDLDALGKPVQSQPKSQMGATLLTLLGKFSHEFASGIDGRGGSADGVEMTELYGGARIAFIFSQVFLQSLMAVQPFDGLSDEEIHTTICNANGTRTSLFVPEISFEMLVKRQIARLEQPGLQCVDLVFDELQRMACQCEPREFARFPLLRERLVEVVGDILRSCVRPTQLMVSNLIKIELAFINTSHPDFLGGSKAVHQLVGNEDRIHYKPPLDSELHTANDSVIDHVLRNPNLHGPPSVVQLPQVPDIMRCPPQSSSPTDRQHIETQIIKSLIESYFSIVRKNFIDLVPKTIMYFLVNHAKDSMQNELVTELYKDSLVEDLMKEADDVSQRRKTCSEMKDLLGKALEIVNEVRDFNTFK